MLEIAYVLLQIIWNYLKKENIASEISCQCIILSHVKKGTSDFTSLFPFPILS